MAQETRIAPIEFSNTPTQVMLNIAENIQQDAARKQQMAFEQQKYLRSLQDEELKRRLENTRNFNSIIQDKQWSKETRDLYLNGLIKKYSVPGMSSTQYLSDIGKDLSLVSNYQRYVDQAYDKADKFVSGLPETSKSGFDYNAFKNDFIKNALFTPDGRQKPLEQLQSEGDVDWLAKTFSDNKDKYYNIASAYKRIPEIIKSATESTIKVPDRDINGRLLTSSSTERKFKPLFERYNEKTGNVEFREDANGYMEDDVYKSLISFDDIDALATRSAKKFIENYNDSSKRQKRLLLGQRSMPAGTFVDNDNDGLPDLLEDNDLDLIKKGFLTDYVKKQMPEYNKENLSTKIINNLSVGSSGPGMKDGYVDGWSQVEAAVDAKDPFSQMDEQVADIILDIADKNTQFRTAGVKSSPELVTVRRGSDGKIRLYLRGKDGKAQGNGVLLSQTGINRKINQSMGKYEATAAEKGDPTPGGPSKKTYNPQTGKYE